MMSHKHDEGGNCSCALQSSGVQSIQEMEFERGIWAAAMDGETGKVKRFLSNGVDPSCTDASGYTALHYAGRNDHLDICRLLLSSGANVNSQTPGGVTPLHRAAYCGHEGVVKELIKNHADVRIVDSDGRTALHKAAIKGHFHIAKLLLAASPESIRIRDSKGQSAGDLSSDSDLKQLLLF